MKTIVSFLFYFKLCTSKTICGTVFDSLKFVFWTEKKKNGCNFVTVSAFLKNDYHF